MRSRGRGLYLYEFDKRKLDQAMEKLKKEGPGETLRHDMKLDLDAAKAAPKGFPRLTW